jgi:hypothetical protein
MIQWIESSVGETTSIVFAIFLVIVATTSDVWEWVAWLKPSRKTTASRTRRGIELTSVMAGTVSMVLFALLFIEVLIVKWMPWKPEWPINTWIFVGDGVCWLALLAAGITAAGAVGLGAWTIGLPQRLQSCASSVNGAPHWPQNIGAPPRNGISSEHRRLSPETVSGGAKTKKFLVWPMRSDIMLAWQEGGRDKKRAPG